MKALSKNLKIILIVHYLFFTSLIYYGCGLFESNIEIKLKGIIIDASNQSPISNAKIGLYKMGWWRDYLLKEVNSNSYGVYKLTYEIDDYCSDSLLKIKVVADGYVYISCTDINPCTGNSSHVKCLEQTQTFNFELKHE